MGFWLKLIASIGAGLPTLSRLEWAESIQMHWHCYPIQLNEWPFISHLMKLPESGRLFPPLFPLSEYGSSAEMKLTLFTLTAEERWFWVKKTTANGVWEAMG